MPGVNETWNEAGLKQVAVKGMDDKRVFTVMNGISASGVVLPLQAIYAGKTAASLPKRTPENANAWDEIKKSGIAWFDWSGNDSYWSTMRTMKIYVNDVLVPYFDAAKEDLGLPKSQLCIWQIDCWSVHRSAEFRAWMATEHPNIQLEYVSGGCTGIWQACDVGIQRVFKHSIRRAVRADMIAEALVAIQKEELGKISAIHLTKSLPVIRDRSVGWLHKAYHAVNDPAFVKKVCIISHSCYLLPY